MNPLGPLPFVTDTPSFGEQLRNVATADSAGTQTSAYTSSINSTHRIARCMEQCIAQRLSCFFNSLLTLRITHPLLAAKVRPMSMSIYVGQQTWQIMNRGGCLAHWWKDWSETLSTSEHSSNLGRFFYHVASPWPDAIPDFDMCTTKQARQEVGAAELFCRPCTILKRVMEKFVRSLRSRKLGRPEGKGTDTSAVPRLAWLVHHIS